MNLHMGCARKGRLRGLRASLTAMARGEVDAVDPTETPGSAKARRVFACMLFDLDNTLVDTKPLVLAAIQRAPRRVTRPTAKEAGSGTSRWGWLRARQEGPTSPCRTHYARLLRTVGLLDPDAPQVLSQLRTRGVRLGLVTSSPRWVVDAVLPRCGLTGYFSRCIITYGTCRRHKPHPDPVLRALSKLSCRADETMYVGDSEDDALASGGAGASFALATWGRGVDRLLAGRVRAVALETIRDLLQYAV